MGMMVNGWAEPPERTAAWVHGAAGSLTRQQLNRHASQPHGCTGEMRSAMLQRSYALRSDPNAGASDSMKRTAVGQHLRTRVTTIGGTLVRGAQAQGCVWEGAPGSHTPGIGDPLHPLSPHPLGLPCHALASPECRAHAGSSRCAAGSWTLATLPVARPPAFWSVLTDCCGTPACRGRGGEGGGGNPLQWALDAWASAAVPLNGPHQQQLAPSIPYTQPQAV